MMFNSFAQVMYKFILNAELQLLFDFKIDSIAFVKDMTLMDLQMYMKSIGERQEQINKAKASGNNSKNFARALIAMRDILNLMTGNI